MQYYLFCLRVIAIFSIISSPNFIWANMEYGSDNALQNGGEEVKSHLIGLKSRLITAIRNGEQDNACQIIQGGGVDIRATVGRQQMTFLQLAIKTGMVCVVECLLAIDPELLYVNDKDGKTPYDYADRREDVQELLRRHDFKNQYAGKAFSGSLYPEFSYSSHRYDNNEPLDLNLLIWPGVPLSLCACCCCVSLTFVGGFLYVGYSAVSAIQELFADNVGDGGPKQ
jgi:hypothetical protein